MWDLLIFALAFVGVVFLLRGYLVKRLDKPRSSPYVIRIETEIPQDELDDYLRRAWDDDTQSRGPELSIEEWKSELVGIYKNAPLPFALSIIYKDLPALRRISVKRIFNGEHAIYLEAWCFKRSDWRMFRLDEIDQVITADGEVFATGSAWFNQNVVPFGEVV